ncbi:MAG: TetR/AcrR family transcriptional regulator [Oleiphilus sp.]
MPFTDEKSQQTEASCQNANQPAKTKARTYAGKSLEDRKRFRRQQFLKAGLCVFGELGFRQASVRRLCKEAQLTDRYFYEECGNLETLLVDVYQQCMTNVSKKILNAIVSEYAQSKDPEKAIISGLEAYFSALENHQVARICMLELEGLNPEVTALYNCYIESFSEILRQLAKHAFPDMTLPVSEQKIIALSLVGAMRQTATHWLTNNYDTERSELVSATSKLFSGMIALLARHN